MQHKHKNVDTIRRGCRTRDMNQITPACLTRNDSEGALRATSHTRLRDCDHYASSTLIGGKGGAGQVHFTLTLEGPTEHVNAT
jgi:hypothetical protein